MEYQPPRVMQTISAPDDFVPTTRCVGRPANLLRNSLRKRIVSIRIRKLICGVFSTSDSVKMPADTNSCTAGFAAFFSVRRDSDDRYKTLYVNGLHC